MEQQIRAKALSDALDSFQLEFLTPSEANLAQLDAWLDGKMSDRQLMESAYEIWQQQRSLS